jgi:hypothetical protein
MKPRVATSARNIAQSSPRDVRMASIISCGCIEEHHDDPLLLLSRWHRGKLFPRQSLNATLGLLRRGNGLSLRPGRSRQRVLKALQVRDCHRAYSPPVPARAGAPASRPARRCRHASPGSPGFGRGGYRNARREGHRHRRYSRMQPCPGKNTKQSQTADRSTFLYAIALVLAIKPAGSGSDVRGVRMAPGGRETYFTRPGQEHLFLWLHFRRSQKHALSVIRLEGLLRSSLERTVQWVDAPNGATC